MARPAVKRKRGRPRTGRKGFKITMLLSTRRRLGQMAQADGMRLGAWLDAKIGASADTPFAPDAVPASPQRRLRQVVKSIVARIQKMDDLLNETPTLVKDKGVRDELWELGAVYAAVGDILREAGLDNFVDRASRKEPALPRA